MNGRDDMDPSGVNGPDRGPRRSGAGDADWFDGGWDAIRRDDSAQPDPSSAADRAAAEPQPPPAGPPSGGRPGGQWTRIGAPPAGGRGPVRPHGARRGGGGEDGGRRLRPAGYVLLTLFIGFGLASLLLAPKLASLAKDQPFGAKRDVLMALTRPLTAVSSLLRLDKPQAAVESALGHSTSQEQSGLATRTHPSETPISSSPGPNGGPSGSPGSSASPPGSFTPTKKDQLALWVGGDSMAMVFGQSVVAMCQQTGVIDAVLDYKVSSGLSRPDFFNWPLRLRAQMKSFDPHVAVAMFGTNDGQSVEYQGEVLQFNTPAWLALYHKRVGAAMDILIGTQRRQVWWVGLPIMQSDAFSKVIKVLDSVYKAEAAKRPDVHWVDTYEMFADKSGRYQDYLPGPSGQTELMRQSDGIHFSRGGADMAAKVVLDQIKAFWHIK
jgi:hypothetical protein